MFKDALVKLRKTPTGINFLNNQKLNEQWKQAEQFFRQNSKLLSCCYVVYSYMQEKVD